MTGVVDSELPASGFGAVDDLAAAYARILESVWALPVFGRQDSAYAELSSGSESRAISVLGWPGLLIWWLRLPFYPIRGWWRSFVIRPVISLYVMIHINSSTSKLHTALLRERISRDVADDVGDVESLDRSIAALDRLKSVTTGWVVLFVLLRFVPLIGLLFSMGLLTVSFTLAEAPEMVDQLVGLVSLLMLIVHPIAVQFGFRWKRALFAGGGVLEPKKFNWSGSELLPRSDVYAMEVRAYDQVGLKRIREFPVDLLLAPGFYLLFNFMIGLGTGSATFDEGEATTFSVIANVVFISLFVVFFAMATVRLGLRYRVRQAYLK
jgi:hypothetical protein